VEAENLLIDATTACDATFPMQTTNDSVTAPKGRLRALLAHTQAMASKAVRQGAATALVTA